MNHGATRRPYTMILTSDSAQIDVLPKDALKLKDDQFVSLVDMWASAEVS